MWFLHPFAFTTDKPGGVAGFRTGGEVPAGEAGWPYPDGGVMGERKLAVTELSCTMMIDAANVPALGSRRLADAGGAE
jgi:hypothetical protein